MTNITELINSLYVDISNYGFTFAQKVENITEDSTEDE